jgi:beta-galactosidase
MGILTYNNKDFYMDGEKYTVLSGTIHYFRVVPEYWEDRLKKLKSCGFNTVETITCWNLHEPKEGVFDFSGILDIERYIKTAADLGLNVILRPGPYICAEWDFGGFPSWLLKYKDMRLRCYDIVFLSKVRSYYKELFSRIGKYQSTNNGNIIAIQIENEYGSYGDDKKYLEAIVDIYKENNIDCLLFTSDGPGYFMLNGGSLDNYLATINFGSNPKGNFELLDKFRPNQPRMCCEFWNGWFDHWYEEHHTRGDDNTAETFEEMLKENASVNFYMFHGGTNFGFYNGANYDQGLQPTITSYDYNCPLSECGDLTPKYYAVKAVMEKYYGKAPEIPVFNLPKKKYGTVSLTEVASLFHNLNQISTPIESAYVKTMEELDQDFGFTLYSTVLTGPFEEMDLEIDGLHDRAIIYIDGIKKGIKERTGKRNDVIKIGLGFGEEAKLDILVENMGRINYGPKIRDEKGILRGVKIGPLYHYGWTMYPITCRDLSSLNFKESDFLITEPTFLKGYFQIEEACDTFVRLEGFTKGNVFVNGFNLGRYWNPAGPQKTLYLPGPLLKVGMNEIIVFELESTMKNEILLTDIQDLG